jgi:hypothetical protein
MGLESHVMTVGAASARTTALLRNATVGSLVPPSMLEGRGSRRLEATAFILPGHGDLGGYLARLAAAREDFAGWDGRVVVLSADGKAAHRAAIVDRYGQVYETTEAVDAADLPGTGDLLEWFRFLATACPECGVLDDPTDRDWVP